MGPRAGLGWVRKISLRPAFGPWTAQLVASNCIDYDMSVHCMYACVLYTCTRSLMCFAVAMMIVFYISSNITLIETYFSHGLFAIFFFLWRCGPTLAMASSFLRFLDHTQRRITVGRTPLDE